MLLYSIILFACAVLFAVLGAAIYRGKTDLIHDYHQTKVTDKAAYGKAFGKSMFVMAAAMALSGIAALLGSGKIFGLLSTAVLILGLLLGIGCILAVQKKYNNGVF